MKWHIILYKGFSVQILEKKLREVFSRVWWKCYRTDWRLTAKSSWQIFALLNVFQEDFAVRGQSPHNISCVRVIFSPKMWVSLSVSQLKSSENALWGDWLVLKSSEKCALDICDLEICLRSSCIMIFCYISQVTKTVANSGLNKNDQIVKRVNVQNALKNITVKKSDKFSTFWLKMLDF